MVTELQQMVKQVKHDVLSRQVPNFKQSESTTEFKSTAEPFNQEMETKVIEDIIEHMKGSFLRAARGTRAISEVDSSVSAAAVDVQLPLGRLPITIRHKRAHNDVDENAG
ncbi:hypothetical protein OSTOST_06379 [Ostertagia ostertagi]